VGSKSIDLTVGAMNQKQLEAFRLVVKTGSVSAAAQQLYVSQPTVSRLLSELELSLDLKLFDRKQGKIELRPEAFKFYKGVEQVFLGSNYLRRVADDIRNSAADHLRVGAFPSFGVRFMSAIIAEFHGDFPNARIALMEATSPSLAELLANASLDISVVMGTPKVAGTQIVRVFQASYVCVMRADDPLMKHDFVDLTQIDSRRIIRLNPLSEVQSLLNGSADMDDGMAGASFNVNLADTACRLVALGLGVAIIDSLSSMELPVPGLIVRPLLPCQPCEFSIMRSEKSSVSSSADALLARIEARCDEIQKTDASGAQFRLSTADALDGTG
jgi:DNA-binding transcriptional LysR family regulator